MAIVAAAAAAAAKRMLRARTPIMIPGRFCSKTPIPATPGVPASISKTFEDFLSYLMSPKLDLARATLLNEEIGKLLKSAPPEIALVQIRGMVEEMSRLCEARTIEARLTRIEVGHEFDRRFGAGVYTFFAALLIGIPFSIYIVSTTGKNERAQTMSELKAVKGRVTKLEKSIIAPPNTKQEDKVIKEPLNKQEDK